MILFGITGSISAFKTINLIRLFIKNGIQCKAIITKGARQFIKAELLVSLGCDVYIDKKLNMFSYKENMAHVNLSRLADKIYIIPASANTLAKLAHGLADNLLTQVILANNDNSKVYFAPSMNINMWENQITQRNIKKLQSLGFNLILPDNGLHACGDFGYGRLFEPEILFKLLNISQDFKNKNVLITVGATVESIDNVRYLSNYSSGKMGFALVKELINRGANVTVLKAKTTINFNICHNNLKIIKTLTADDMNKAMLKLGKNNNIFIGCAAVSDYKIKNKFINKIKKINKILILKFIRNPDILINCKKAYPKIFTIGFAAESDNITKYAKDKLIKKKINMIVANNINVFNKDNSSVRILSKYKNMQYKNKPKSEIAKIILDFAIKIL